MVLSETVLKLSKPSSIIALDCSTTSMAFSIFEKGVLKKYGKITFVGNDALYKAGDASKKTIPFFRKFRCDAVVFESGIYSNSAKTAMQLSLVQGSIMGASQFAGIRIIKTVTPMQWQNYIGTKLLSAAEKKSIVQKNPGMSKSWYKAREREMRKQRTIDYVNNRYGTKISDNDIADSLGLGSYVNDKWGVVFD